MDIIKFAVDVQNWSIKCEYHNVVQSQVVMSTERLCIKTQGSFSNLQFYNAIKKSAPIYRH